MKKYLLALSALTIVSVAANAQTTTNQTDSTTTFAHHSKDGFHKHHGSEMMKGLNLTDAQKQQAKDINADYKKQLTDLKNGNLSATDYNAKKLSLEKDRKSKFQSILTGDQKSNMAAAKKDRSSKMKMTSQKRMDKMKTNLNLSDGQVAKIKEQKMQSMSQAKAIKENTSLTEEQKKEQLRNLKKNSRENMNSILSADQLKKKEELRNQRMSEMKNKKAIKES